MNTSFYTLRAKVDYGCDPITHFLSGVPDKGMLINSLEFDLNISGYVDNSVYFLIDRLWFTDMKDLIDGELNVLLETNLDIESNPIAAQNLDKISVYISDLNPAILFLDFRFKHGVACIPFNTLSIYD